MSEEFLKYDAGKPRMELLPPNAVAQVLFEDSGIFDGRPVFAALGYMSGDLGASPVARALMAELEMALCEDGEAGRHLMPRALESVGAVLTFGAVKYAPNNWRLIDERSRYTGAMLRHLMLHERGQDRLPVDSESYLPHLAHAATCALFLLECELCNLGEDTVRLKPQDGPGDE